MQSPAFPDAGSADAALPAVTGAVAEFTQRLHCIASRTDPAQIAAELLRLNDQVRAAAEPRLPTTAPPADYLLALVELADRFPEERHGG